MEKKIWMALTAVFAVTTLALGAALFHLKEPGARDSTLPDYLSPGSNEMLRTGLDSVDGVEIIVSDVVIPPNSQVPRHYHPGEEVAYVIAGSAIHIEEGKADMQTEAGDAFVIPVKAVHSPRGGPEGARAIVFRVHVEGEPERILVPENE